MYIPQDPPLVLHAMQWHVKIYLLNASYNKSINFFILISLIYKHFLMTF